MWNAGYRNEIKVFELKDNINLLMKSNPNKFANCNIGDLLVCYDGKMFFHCFIARSFLSMNAMFSC